MGTSATRHDADAIERLIAWTKENRKTAIWTAVSLAVVGGGIWFYIAAKARREAFAERELQQARYSASAGNTPLATSDLARVASTYRNTKGGQEAAITLAQLRLLQGQAAIAIPDLRQFLASGPDQEYVGSAHALLAAAFEQTGQLLDAAKEYEAAANTYPYAFLKAQNLVEAGRTYTAAGDSAAARAAYERVLKDYQDQPGALEARIRLAELSGGKADPAGPTADKKG